MKYTQETRSLAAALFTYGLLAVGANAAVLTFPSSGSTYNVAGPSNQSGFLFNTTHFISESIATPNTPVDRIQFTLALDFNSLNSGGTVNLSFILEGSSQFSISFNQSSPLGNYFFDEAVTPFTIVDGFADVVLQVTNNVPGGLGSVSFAQGSNNLELSAIPEPSSVLLLTFGALGIAGYRRRIN